MKFYDIGESDMVVPGEFLLYVPKQAIVICGAYDGTIIKALNDGKVFKDKVANFKKITLPADAKKRKYISTCKGCGR